MREDAGVRTEVGTGVREEDGVSGGGRKLESRRRASKRPSDSLSRSVAQLAHELGARTGGHEGCSAMARRRGKMSGMMK